MKKLMFNKVAVILMAFVSVFLISCSSDDDEEKQSMLTLDVTNLTFTATGQSQSMRITSNTHWTISGCPSWLSVNPTSGDNTRDVIVTANENTSTDSRTCQLIISTDDGLQQIVTVEQAGILESMSVDITELRLDGRSGSNGLLRITSNVAWTITGIPDWLSFSSTSGNSSAAITVTALSGNNSSAMRECTITISSLSGGQTLEVSVIQSGLFSAGCKVTPTNIVTLSDGVAFDYEYEGNVTYFYRKLYTPDLLERMTDIEIINDMTSDIGDRLTPNDDYVTAISNIESLTDYVICTVGFDSDGRNGELVRTPVRTKNDANQAIAVISDVKYNDTYWMWTTTPNAYVTRYYQAFISNYDLYNDSDVMVAWYYHKDIQQNPEDNEPIAQGGSWRRERNGGTVFHVVTWAVGADGSFSGVIDRFGGTIDAKSNKKIMNAKSNNPSKEIIYEDKQF